MIKTESAITKKSILFHNTAVAVSIVVDDAASVTENGRKLVKAGTPMTGDLTARGTAFTVSADTGEAPNETSDAIGILQHDVDVTDGNNNGSLIIRGEIDLNKVDATTVELITAAAKKSIGGRILFLK